MVRNSKYNKVVNRKKEYRIDLKYNWGIWTNSDIEWWVWIS